MKNIESLCSKGSTVTLVKQGTQDEFGELTSEETLNVKAFPIRHAPFNRSTIDKVAWATEVEVLVYISKKAQDDKCRSLRDLRDYKEMKVENKRYDIRYVELYMNVKDDFLYYIFGGKKP